MSNFDRNHEITNRQSLLNEKGELREPGWSRRMVQQYRRKMIKAPRLRIKEWDYYLVMGDGFAGAFTISDNGYIGLQSVSLLLFDDVPNSLRHRKAGDGSSKNPVWEHTETILKPFPMGRLKLPEDSHSGFTQYEDKRLWMSFEPNIEKKADKGEDEETNRTDNSVHTRETGHHLTTKIGRHIMCSFDKFFNGKSLSADIFLEEPDMDSMVIATPWDKKHAFYYNQKINCMRASGYIEFDGKRYEFDPAGDFGTLDWGRGVWTYDNTWYWGSGNADIDGHSFGFNIGYGFGNTAAATENVLFYDGKAHKLDDVTFHIPESYMDPWKFTSSDGRFEMDFEPVLDRAAKIDFKVLISDQHQVFGRISGKAVLDDGTVIDVKDMMCFAEKVHNRY